MSCDACEILMLLGGKCVEMIERAGERNVISGSCLYLVSISSNAHAIKVWTYQTANDPDQVLGLIWTFNDVNSHHETEKGRRINCGSVAGILSKELRRDLGWRDWGLIWTRLVIVCLGLSSPCLTAPVTKWNFILDLRIKTTMSGLSLILVDQSKRIFANSDPPSGQTYWLTLDL